MIREIIRKPHHRYGGYFLSIEAPGDEEETSVIKSNTKVIDVKPNNRKKIDFTDGAEEPEEIEEPSEERPEEEPVDTDVDMNDENDYTTDEQNIGEVQPELDTVTDPVVNDPNQVEQIDATAPAEDTTDVVDTDTTEDFTSDTTSTDTGLDTTTDDGTTPTVDTDGDGNPDETNDDTTGGDVDIDTGGGEDFTADTGTTDDASATTDTTQTDQKGPGIEYDSTRKYILFGNFISLSNAIENYISKLENNFTDNTANNKIIKTAVNKLKEIEELCDTYMTMKFEASGYIQSLLFFQNLIVMIQLVFEYVKKASKMVKNTDSE